MFKRALKRLNRLWIQHRLRRLLRRVALAGMVDQARLDAWVPAGSYRMVADGNVLPIPMPEDRLHQRAAALADRINRDVYEAVDRYILFGDIEPGVAVPLVTASSLDDARVQLAFSASLPLDEFHLLPRPVPVTVCRALATTPDGEIVGIVSGEGQIYGYDKELMWRKLVRLLGDSRWLVVDAGDFQP